MCMRVSTGFKVISKRLMFCACTYWSSGNHVLFGGLLSQLSLILAMKGKLHLYTRSVPESREPYCTLLFSMEGIQSSLHIETLWVVDTKKKQEMRGNVSNTQILSDSIKISPVSLSITILDTIHSRPNHLNIYCHFEALSYNVEGGDFHVCAPELLHM